MIEKSPEAKAISRADQISALLRDLRESDPDIEATAVVSVDGAMVASCHQDGRTEERLAAMTAAMVGWGERIASELSRGELDQVLIRGAEGSVILVPVNEEAVLTVLIKDEVKLGLVFLDMRRTAANLAEVV